MGSDLNRFSNQENSTEERKPKFSLTLYVSAVMCLDIIVFVLYTIYSPSHLTDFGGFGPVVSPGSYKGVFSIVKTNDMAAKNLYTYIMENPDKLGDREKMAGNIQESGIDLYQKNINMLSLQRNKVPKEVFRDMKTLMEYYSLNKRLFIRLKASVQSGRKAVSLDSGSLKYKINAMADKVEDIYDKY